MKEHIVLSGNRVAILVADGFAQLQLEQPRAALRRAGADTYIVSPNRMSVKSWFEGEFGGVFDVDVNLEEADAEEFDALVIPGGVMSADNLRNNRKAIEFVRSFVISGKPVAAICHGPQILINANVLLGHKVTSNAKIRMDLVNAGADWLDESVVVDQGLITSRGKADLSEFSAKVIGEIAESVHAAAR